jgi:serine/threonine protein kinase
VTSAADRLGAALSGRYAVERELGRGGMATVYLARDLRHGRHVAARIEPGTPGAPPRVASREIVIDPLHYDPVSNHANWDVTADGRFVFIEPLAGGRLMMVFDWRPTGESAR